MRCRFVYTSAVPARSSSKKFLRYYFGRLNLTAAYDDKRTFLLESLASRTFYESYRARWGFFNRVSLKCGGEEYVHGELVKFKAEGSEEIVVPEQGVLSTAAIANQVLARSEFFLHIKSGALAFHPGPQVKRDTFASRFASVVENAHGGFFVEAEVQFIHTPENVLAALRRFDHIGRLHITLHPSNPSMRDVWRSQDERLKRLEAKTFEEEYTAAPDGSLRIADDLDVVAKITMAEDGYGKARVDGTIDGHPVTISTRDNPVTADIDSEQAREPARALELLAASFEGIFSRFS